MGNVLLFPNTDTVTLRQNYINTLCGHIRSNAPDLGIETSVEISTLVTDTLIKRFEMVGVDDVPLHDYIENLKVVHHELWNAMLVDLVQLETLKSRIQQSM